MPTRNYKPEQIVTVLRQIEVQMANGKTAPHACQEAEIHTQTYSRWRKEYGGLKREPAKRLQELEKGTARRSRGSSIATGGTPASSRASATTPPRLRRRAGPRCPE